MRPKSTGPSAADSPVNRSPAPDLDRVHQIVLPTPWDVGGLGPVQIYVVDSDPFTLIDTGLKDRPSWTALRAAFDELGFRFETIERIVLTHYHDDHLGQAETLRGLAPSLDVWAYHVEVPIIESFSPRREEDQQGTPELYREYGVPEKILTQWTGWRENEIEQVPLCESTAVDRRLGEGDRIPFEHFELEVIPAPGHSAGLMMLYEPETGTLIGADHILHRTMPFTETYYLQEPATPGEAWRRRRARFRGFPAYLGSLRELRRRSFSRILPGHRDVITDPAGAIASTIAHCEKRLDHYEAALRKAAEKGGGSATGWDLWLALFPQADPVRELKLRMLALIGCLDVLEDEDRIVTQRREDGILKFSPGR